MVGEYEALAGYTAGWSATEAVFGADLKGAKWRSVHLARWHSNERFIVQHERANGPFDTLRFRGWDVELDTHFLWSIGNDGFARDYLGNP